MLNTLLTTKLNIPQLRPALIPRPRLIKKLNAGLAGRLTLVSAPAGFGKTTLVSDWLNQRSSSPNKWKTEHCTWLSLDQYDNEPVRFLQYLIAAIQMVHPNLGVELLETIDNSPNPNTLALAQDLINEIAGFDQPLLIILDDYHEIQNDHIHKILQTVIDSLPPHAHLVITTRQDPPIPLPRWRVRNWLNEITTNDLRFDKHEAGEFLSHTMNVEVNPEAVSMLEERTEGWVAGLQLAALSLADTDFSPDVIQEFGGRDRYVSEYLFTEVLDQQSSDVQQFLLYSSVLDRINADLCAAVLHPEDSPDKIHLINKVQNLIKTLERSNLFIIALDREAYWYRYHHLFAQLLRQHLAQIIPPDEIYELFRRAAAWHADKGFVEEAINYALQGKDFSFAASLICNIELDSLWNPKRGSQLIQWGAALPMQTLQEFPQATIQIAFAHMTRNEIMEAIHYVELVRQDPRLNAEILLVDSIFNRNKGEVTSALSLAIQAAALFELQNEAAYIAAQTQIIICLTTLGKLSDAEILANSLRDEIQTQSGKFLNVHIQLIQMLGLIQEKKGELVEAERTYLEGIEIIEKSSQTMPLIGLLQVRLSAIYYQWNEIKKADEYCRTGLAWGERTGIADIITQGLMVQMDLVILRKDKMEAQTTLERFSKLLDWPGFPELRSIIRADQAIFNIRLGNLAAAIRWANSSRFELEDQPSLKYRNEYRSLLSVRYEEIRQLGNKDQVSNLIAVVDKWITLSTANNHIELAIYYGALKALLLEYQGQGKKAMTALHQALDLGFPGGYLRIFRDFGNPMRDLLQKSLRDNQHMVYKRRILMAFSEEQIAPTRSVSTTIEFPVTLTPREFEILQLIAAGLSNKAIQEKLMLSNNTIRTHIKNLYSKLGVHSRTQAIQQARKNGLI